MSCLIHRTLVELTVDALSFLLYLHSFAYGRTHKKSLKNKKNTWLAAAKIICQEKNAVEGNSDL